MIATSNLRAKESLRCSSSANNARSDYSGTRGRWATLTLYRPRGASSSVSELIRRRWEGEKDCSRGAVCDTEDEVVDFFGDDWLAKELYVNGRH